jgi:HEAT repeat protein
MEDRAVRPLLAAVKDPDPWVRTEVVWALGEFNSPLVIKPLVAASSDPDRHVREQAAYALPWSPERREANARHAAFADREIQ